VATVASPARACALRVVRRVFERGAYADRALAAEAAALGPRDRALAMQIAYGTVQRRATLDYVLARLLSRPRQQLDPAVLAALWIGLFQLLFLDGIADHAAVNESVELVKRPSPGGARVVNAVLRRAAVDGAELVASLTDGDPEAAAVAHSVPVWLAQLWWRELGPDAARALLRHVNEPAESALRVNALRARTDDVTARLPVPAARAARIPEGLVLDGPFDAQASELWSEGAIMPQSRGSMLVSRLLAPRPGERVLDLCAAPGAKTTHLAALLGDRGELLAVERHAGRARALARTCARMGADRVHVEIADATAPRAEGPFDRVLVDPPCSGLGTLQSRPDLRWRATPEAIAELVPLQGRILANGAAATRPGGTIVYSVCTLNADENEAVVDASGLEVESLGAEWPQYAHPRRPEFLLTLPHRDRTSGFFIARLRRP
jgi:16S rRNA (cytosine967-C5)-methyltransferase